jgi:hypothetical protein
MNNKRKNKMHKTKLIFTFQFATIRINNDHFDLKAILRIFHCQSVSKPFLDLSLMIPELIYN